MEILGRTLHTSSQLPVRISILLITMLFVLAGTFGLEPILGAFAAGMVFGLASRGKEGKPLREKIDAVSFGLFIPFFFVTSGMNFDAAALVQSPTSLLMLPVFLFIFLFVRGIPTLIYRNDLAGGERLPFALYSATALPIVLAITDIGIKTGEMKQEIATGLVGAAMLSVLLFPAIANTLLARVMKVETEESAERNSVENL
jgi:Kef-type K+ transport system membrane component KefB